MSSRSDFEERAKAILDRFRSLSEDQKKEVVNRILQRFIDMYREKGPLTTGLSFIRFLATPDGAVVWGYLAQPQYVEEWVALGVAILKLAPRIVSLLVV